jgi:hypothetical protein
VTAVTLLFQFRDAFVEGIQFAFEFLDFMLSWKSPGKRFVDRWSLLGTRAPQTFSALCRHGSSESRALGYFNLA